MTCTVCFPRNWRQITYVTLVQIHARYCWVYLWPSSSDPLIEIEGSDWTITPVWPLTPLKNTHWGRQILNCKTHLRVGESNFFNGYFSPLVVEILLTFDYVLHANDNNDAKGYEFAGSEDYRRIGCPFHVGWVDQYYEDWRKSRRTIQYRYLIPAPVDQTSASAWFHKHPWIMCLPK